MVVLVNTESPRYDFFDFYKEYFTNTIKFINTKILI